MPCFCERSKWYKADRRLIDPLESFASSESFPKRKTNETSSLVEDLILAFDEVVIEFDAGVETVGLQLTILVHHSDFGEVDDVAFKRNDFCDFRMFGFELCFHSCFVIKAICCHEWMYHRGVDDEHSTKSDERHDNQISAFSFQELHIFLLLLNLEQDSRPVAARGICLQLRGCNPQPSALDAYDRCSTSQSCGLETSV